MHHERPLPAAPFSFEELGRPVAEPRPDLARPAPTVEIPQRTALVAPVASRSARHRHGGGGGRIVGRLVAGLLILVLLGGGTALYLSLSGKLGDVRAQVDQLEAANAALEDENGELQDAVSAATGQRDAARQRRTTVEDRLAACRTLFRRVVEIGVSGLTPTEAEAFNLTRDVVECYNGFPEFLGPAPDGTTTV